MGTERDMLQLTFGRAVRDGLTVAPDREATSRLLEAMAIHRSRTHTDDPGTVSEMFESVGIRRSRPMQRLPRQRLPKRSLSRS